MPNNDVLVKIPVERGDCLDYVVERVKEFVPTLHRQVPTIAPYELKEVTSPDAQSRVIVFKFRTAWLRIVVRRDGFPTRVGVAVQSYSYSIAIKGDERQAIAMRLTSFLTGLGLG